MSENQNIVPVHQREREGFFKVIKIGTIRTTKDNCKNTNISKKCLLKIRKHQDYFLEPWAATAAAPAAAASGSK